MSVPAAILDRIAKCDRLANSPVPGEAAAARAMAAKLRAKYSVPAGSYQHVLDEDGPIYSGYDPKHRPQRDYAYEAAFRANMDRHLDKMMAQSLADRLPMHGFAVVEVEGGWLFAPTGTRVLTDAQLIAEAKKAGFETKKAGFQ